MFTSFDFGRLALLDGAEYVVEVVEALEAEVLEPSILHVNAQQPETVEKITFSLLLRLNCTPIAFVGTIGAQ